LRRARAHELRAEVGEHRFVSEQVLGQVADE
jgi:hypothetical protein